MGRMDGRDKETFKRDIKYGTMIEKFWMKTVYFKGLFNHEDFSDMTCFGNMGVDNSGEYVEKSNGNADYIIYFKDRDPMPLEIKWCPTKGKATFKKHDLKNYLEQGASILLVYNDGEPTLKQPRDADWVMQLELIESCLDQIVWGIISPKAIEDIMKFEEQVKIKYMGGKQGYIIQEENLPAYLTFYKFELE